jgi:GDPmannose 4,6-dehydratase
MQELESDDFKISEDHITNLDGSFPKLRLGNLNAYRDWGYAGDYCEAMWMMLQQDEPDDYVICTGKTHSIRYFLDIAFSHIGINNWSDYVVQDPEFYRPAEVDYLRGDASKAEKKLGWKPKHSFEDLVKIMVNHDLK